METNRPPAHSADRKIVSADALKDLIVIAFDNGEERVFTAETLYALMPEEFAIAEQIKQILE